MNLVVANSVAQAATAPVRGSAPGRRRIGASQHHDPGTLLDLADRGARSIRAGRRLLAASTPARQLTQRLQLTVAPGHR
jgi:hypothetical protein